VTPYLQQYLEGKAFVYELLLLETRQHVLHKLLGDDVTTSTILCTSTGHAAGSATVCQGQRGTRR
jgi:hypothetical protein